MAGTAFTGAIKHSPIGLGGKYDYRGGTGMMPSAEFAVLHDDFLYSVTTNVPIGWDAAVIDTGATVVTDTTAASATGVLLFDSDGATEGAAIYGEKTMQLTSGKKFWMEMRFKTEIADDSDVQFGLTSLTATTNPEDLWTTTATDVVAFGVLDGTAVTGILSDVSNAGTAVAAVPFHWYLQPGIPWQSSMTALAFMVMWMARSLCLRLLRFQQVWHLLHSLVSVMVLPRLQKVNATTSVLLLSVNHG